jgi:hypothetical protein
MREQETKRELKKGAYELILAGRHPSAVARLSPSKDDGAMRGEAEFYMTPLGVVLCAEVDGLPKEQSGMVFGLCIGDDQMPIYACAGSAWCAIMTGYRSVSDLIGKPLTVRQSPDVLSLCGTVCAPTAV